MHAIISLNDEKYQPLSDITWNQNKLLYAQRHGYGAICKIDDLRPNTNIGYQKIYFIRDVMDEHPEYDWIWWTGTDSMITNFAARIEDRIDNDYHFIICVDVNGLNADSFLIRNTPEGRALIEDILSIEVEATEHWDAEQRAMAMIMGLPVTAAPWPISNHVPINEKYESIVKVVPQRFMNSYNYQMYHYSDHRDKLGIDGNWHPGDWLIHWPAASLEQRIQLSIFYMEHIVK